MQEPIDSCLICSIRTDSSKFGQRDAIEFIHRYPNPKSQWPQSNQEPAIGSTPKEAKGS